MNPDPLDSSTLRTTLHAPWRSIEVVDETGSTNADLLARAAAGVDVDGAILLAEHQTAGRGRHGRRWSAPPRSQLSMSVGVGTESMPTEAWGWLPLLTGVAIVDAVRETTGVDAGLKWPNDVLAGGRKLAGILAEVAAPSPAVVIGMGLNVAFAAHESPDPNATSLAMLGSSVLDRNLLTRNILAALGSRLAQWRAAGGPDGQLTADYRGHSLTMGARVKASLPGDRELVGVAVDVDELGRLRIDTGDDVATVSAGDITHLRPLPP